ncbi:MAG: uracil phosphoribosyltransferase [Lachnospirales bacterium]|nr:uracil phosphoribosyltransferase [Clostridiales bacterium]
MSKLYIVDHPVVQSKVTRLRDINTSNKEFRELVAEIASFICYEATKDLETKEIEVESVLCKTKGNILNKKVGIVPILRAGLGMVDGILNLIPNASIGHIGLYRDPETLLPVEYYCKLPSSDPLNTDILLIDPMLATGGTAIAAMQFIKERGFKNIKFLCLISSPEGVKKVSEAHPDIDIYTASLDDHLNDHGYIIPGLGDAGDRIFGTK